MPPFVIALIIIFAALCALLISFSAFLYKVAFGRRCDKNPNIKYFTAGDFDLSAESIEVKDDKVALRGAVYRDLKAAGNGNSIIFVHGMGPGHAAYTTEIAYFCRLGYRVIALDSRGCNLSDGKGIKGIYQGVKTARCAIGYVRERAFGGKIYLVGHSWGAYSALCASAECGNVDKVVAISAPLSPLKIITEELKRALGVFAYILVPFWGLVNLLTFGARGNANAAKCAQKNGVPTLLVQGGKDRAVKLENSAYSRANGENITKLFAEEKAHNPYNTVNAEKKLAELSELLKNGCKDFSSFDFSAATEEDEEVMRTISDFLNK